MSQNDSHEDFLRRLEEFSCRLEDAVSKHHPDTQPDAVQKAQRAKDIRQRHDALKEQLDRAGPSGWAQAGKSLELGLSGLLDEFGRLFGDADDKYRHRDES